VASVEELTLAVVGLDYPNADRGSRRFEALLCHPGDPVSLRPEPRNPHDPHAVAVLSERGVQIGYLTAERAPWIGGRLRQGVPVVAMFQGMAGAVAYIRLRFGGEAPQRLPPITPTGDPTPVAAPEADDSGFHPDPDGPEWGA
jgi:hypothetical protein